MTKRKCSSLGDGKALRLFILMLVDHGNMNDEPDKFPPSKELNVCNGFTRTFNLGGPLELGVDRSCLLSS